MGHRAELQASADRGLEILALRPLSLALGRPAMTPDNPHNLDTSKLQSGMPDPSGSAPLVDRQLIRCIVPVLAGTILGGLLTGIPTVWVSITQQRVQVDLAKRAEQEQVRQRRVQTAKNYLTACSELALTEERIADSLESEGKISTLANEYQKATNVHSVSLAEVVAEFGFSEIALSDSVAVPDSADPPGARSRLSAKERAQGIRSRAARIDRSCREVTDKLLRAIRVSGGRD